MFVGVIFQAERKCNHHADMHSVEFRAKCFIDDERISAGCVIVRTRLKTELTSLQVTPANIDDTSCPACRRRTSPPSKRSQRVAWEGLTQVLQKASAAPLPS